MFSKIQELRADIYQIILSFAQLPLIIAIILVNTEFIYQFNITSGNTIIFYLYGFISLGGIFAIRKRLFKSYASEQDIYYFIKSIFLITLLTFIGSIFSHFFIAEHIGQADLYLRSYGRVAFLYTALALCVSPVLIYIKNSFLRENIILLRKIFGITAFIFFLKHGLEYFAVDYIFQTLYYSDVSYSSYVFDNMKLRNDAITGIIAGIMMLLLGITSNKFSMKFLGGKGWKRVQSLVYPVFLISLIHVAFSSRMDSFYIFLAGGIVILRTLAYFSKNTQEQTGPTTRYLCVPCGFIYDEATGDPDGGLAPGTKFEDIPDDWVCPVCGVRKTDFIPYYDGGNTIFGGYIATIFSYILLTPNVLELVLQVEQKIDVKVGQYMILILRDFDGEFSRAYSVAKYEEGKITFLIRLKDIGRAGRMFRGMQVGNDIKIQGIYGEFTLQDTPNPKVFIASGTGLAPIYRMISADTSGASKKLLFGVRKKEDLFYQEQLTATESLDIDIYLSQEIKIPKSKNTNIQYISGRMDFSQYKFSPETEFYICGAPALVDSAKKYLGEQGYRNVYFETF